MTKAEQTIFGKLRELFASTHWTQGRYSQWNEADDKLTYCFVGGLRMVVGGDADSSAAEDVEYRRTLLEVVQVLAADGNDAAQALLDDDTTVGTLLSAPNGGGEVPVFEDVVIEWNDGDTALADVLRVIDAASERAA